MTPVQARPTAIIASPTQVVLQPQQQQQIVGANNLTANSLLQLQQQQQQILIANSGTLLNLCNSKQNQAFGNGSSSNKSCNGDNNENVNQQNSIAGPFKVYSEYIDVCAGVYEKWCKLCIYMMCWNFFFANFNVSFSILFQKAFGRKTKKI